jgi:hypothetical protein
MYLAQANGVYADNADLSVAAVLSTFSSTHELGTPHVIPGYIA